MVYFKKAEFWHRTGSMICTLSPAEFVWTIRTVPACAAEGETVANGNERVRARKPGTTNPRAG